MRLALVALVAGLIPGCTVILPVITGVASSSSNRGVSEADDRNEAQRQACIAEHRARRSSTGADCGPEVRHPRPHATAAWVVAGVAVGLVLDVLAIQHACRDNACGGH